VAGGTVANLGTMRVGRDLRGDPRDRERGHQGKQADPAPHSQHRDLNAPW
jgi:hypothetical protein